MLMQGRIVTLTHPSVLTHSLTHTLPPRSLFFWWFLSSSPSHHTLCNIHARSILLLQPLPLLSHEHIHHRMMITQPGDWLWSLTSFPSNLNMPHLNINIKTSKRWPFMVWFVFFLVQMVVRINTRMKGVAFAGSDPDYFAFLPPSLPLSLSFSLSFCVCICMHVCMYLSHSHPSIHHVWFSSTNLIYLLFLDRTHPKHVLFTTPDFLH